MYSKALQWSFHILKNLRCCNNSGVDLMSRVHGDGHSFLHGSKDGK